MLRRFEVWNMIPLERMIGNSNLWPKQLLWGKYFLLVSYVFLTKILKPKSMNSPVIRGDQWTRWIHRAGKSPGKDLHQYHWQEREKGHGEITLSLSLLEGGKLIEKSKHVSKRGGRKTFGQKSSLKNHTLSQFSGNPGGGGRAGFHLLALMYGGKSMLVIYVQTEASNCVEYCFKLR